MEVRRGTAVLLSLAESLCHSPSWCCSVKGHSVATAPFLVLRRGKGKQKIHFDVNQHMHSLMKHHTMKTVERDQEGECCPGTGLGYLPVPYLFCVLYS